MSKKNKMPLAIFAESIGLYFSNFDKFVKYMSYPVLGQIVGLSLTLMLTFFYTKNIPNLLSKFPVLDDFGLLISILLLITLPGLVIFMNAFWEYLVAYGAINSMAENMLKSGKVYDFDAHTELIKRRILPYIGIWILFGIFSLLAMVPLLFWIPCLVFAVYFVLVFQVFTYEPELSPIGCLKRSFQLVKGHFASTAMLIMLVGALTYVLIPQLANLLFEVIKLTDFCAKISLPIIESLPISDLNNLLTTLYLAPLKSTEIAMFFVTTLVAQVFIQFTLPLRSILWAMWYKELNGGKLYVSNEDKPRQKASKKKPSEKLMEASSKKYSSKKLDRNILRRAMEKDE